MTLGRISSNYMSTRASSLLGANQLNLSQLQERLSLGRNIVRPSDDPLGMTKVLDVEKQLNESRRFLGNIRSGLSEVNVTDSTMRSLTDVVQRAMELATQGATASVSPQNANSLAQEVDQLIDQAVALGNTKVGDKYIFGGLRTNTLPFIRTNDDITYAGTLSTENSNRDLRIGPSTTITLNQTGDSVFGSVASTGGPPPVVSAGAGLFRTLMTLKQSLEANDKATIRNQLDVLETDLSSLNTQQGQVGALINRLELTQTRLEGTATDLSEQYATLQDIDVAKLVTDLRYQESVYQASLAVVGRSLQPSLINSI